VTETWFLLKNETDALLPAFMGSRPIPHSNCEYGAAWTDLPRLPPLLEIVRGLLQKGLTGKEIMWTFLNRGVQPLCQLEAAVRMPPEPSCLVRPSFSRPGDVETNTRVQEALVLGDLARQEVIMPAASGCGCKG
jgi:hypothetical protein